MPVMWMHVVVHICSYEGRARAISLKTFVTTLRFNYFIFSRRGSVRSPVLEEEVDDGVAAVFVVEEHEQRPVHQPHALLQLVQRCEDRLKSTPRPQHIIPLVLALHI